MHDSVLRDGYGIAAVRLARRRGSAVAGVFGARVCSAPHPTGQLHQVRPVTSGERLAVVAWIQSHVRETAAREVLRDLARTLEILRPQHGQSDAYDLVNKTHMNLLQRWSEP